MDACCREHWSRHSASLARCAEAAKEDPQLCRPGRALAGIRVRGDVHLLSCRVLNTISTEVYAIAAILIARITVVAVRRMKSIRISRRIRHAKSC